MDQDWIWGRVDFEFKGLAKGKVKTAFALLQAVHVMELQNDGT